MFNIARINRSPNICKESESTVLSKVFKYRFKTYLDFDIYMAIFHNIFYVY